MLSKRRTGLTCTRGRGIQNICFLVKSFTHSRQRMLRKIGYLVPNWSCPRLIIRVGVYHPWCDFSVYITSASGLLSSLISMFADSGELFTLVISLQEIRDGDGRVKQEPIQTSNIPTSNILHSFSCKTLTWCCYDDSDPPVQPRHHHGGGVPQSRGGHHQRLRGHEEGRPVWVRLLEVATMLVSFRPGYLHKTSKDAGPPSFVWYVQIFLMSTDPHYTLDWYHNRAQNWTQYL